MAQNGDFITECEKLMDKWCKQIEKVEKKTNSNRNFLKF
jgi:hypothetical protein